MYSGGKQYLLQSVTPQTGNKGPASPWNLAPRVSPSPSVVYTDQGNSLLSHSHLCLSTHNTTAVPVRRAHSFKQDSEPCAGTIESLAVQSSICWRSSERKMSENASQFPCSGKEKSSVFLAMQVDAQELSKVGWE